MDSEVNGEMCESVVAEEDRFDLLKDLAEFSGNNVPSNLTDLLRCWDEQFRREAKGKEFQRPSWNGGACDGGNRESAASKSPCR